MYESVLPSLIGFIRVKHNGSALLELQILGSEPPSDFDMDSVTNNSLSEVIYSQIMEYITHERLTFDLPIETSHYTPFQRSVTEELLRIPYGETRSYLDIARAIGNPKASRAVGAACNRNPIHIIIPCHRVVSSRGALTGYAAGVETKRCLLDLESSVILQTKG